MGAQTRRSGARMRIVENTPSRLVLRDRTLWISAVLLGAAVVLLAHYVRAHDQTLIPALVSVAFALPFLRSTDVIFDKSERICALRRFDMLQMTSTRLEFRDLKDIRVETCPMDDSQAVSCRLSLVTASATLPLTVSYEPSLERYNQMRETIVDAVFAAGHKPQAVDPVLDLVQQGRTIDAVALLRKREGLDLTTAVARVDEMQRAAGLKETFALHRENDAQGRLATERCDRGFCLSLVEP